MSFLTPKQDGPARRDYRGMPFAASDVGDWLEARLADEPWLFAVVPTGFEAYARVFHPAYRKVQGTEQPEILVSRKVSLSQPAAPATLVRTGSRASQASDDSFSLESNGDRKPVQPIAKPRHLSMDLEQAGIEGAQFGTGIGVAKTSDTAVATPKTEDGRYKGGK